jgi:hypothetical protein
MTEAPRPATPIRVKFMVRGRREPDLNLWTRQFPGRVPVWGNCEFILDPEAREYDWLAVYDDLPAVGSERFSKRCETLACPREHTLLITTEPSSIKFYGNDFLAQFGHILTSHEPWARRHPSVIYSQPALRWYYGVRQRRGGVCTFEQLLEGPTGEKSRLISTVCSSKRQRHTIHRERYDFVQALKTRMPELEVFGHGVRPMDDKAEALDPYRYHIAIENHVGLHHWTEKLSDAFLGLTLPFYFGAPNAADYFPADSFIPIDIRDVGGAERIIRDAIAAGEYERRLPAIREARRRVLYEHNLFAVISGIVRERSVTTRVAHFGGRISSRRRLRQIHPWRYPVFGIQKLWVRFLARRAGAT